MSGLLVVATLQPVCRRGGQYHQPSPLRRYASAPNTYNPKTNAYRRFTRFLRATCFSSPIYTRGQWFSRLSQVHNRLCSFWVFHRHFPSPPHPKSRNACFSRFSQVYNRARSFWVFLRHLFRPRPIFPRPKSFCVSQSQFTCGLKLGEKKIDPGSCLCESDGRKLNQSKLNRMQNDYEKSHRHPRR